MANFTKNPGKASSRHGRELARRDPIKENYNVCHLIVFGFERFQEQTSVRSTVGPLSSKYGLVRMRRQRFSTGSAPPVIHGYFFLRMMLVVHRPRNGLVQKIKVDTCSLMTLIFKDPGRFVSEGAGTHNMRFID